MAEPSKNTQAEEVREELCECGHPFHEGKCGATVGGSKGGTDEEVCHCQHYRPITSLLVLTPIIEKIYLAGRRNEDFSINEASRELHKLFATEKEAARDKRCQTCRHSYEKREDDRYCIG